MKRLLLMMAILAGCAPGHLATRSGRPEVTVNEPRAKAHASCVAWCAVNGWEIKTETESSIIAEINTSSSAASLFGKEYYWRQSFTFTGDNPTTVYVTRSSIQKDRDVGTTEQGVLNTQKQLQEQQNDLEAALKM